MNSTIRTQEKVEKDAFSMTVDAGHGAIDLTAELAFDRSKGTFKITCSLTTKHVNINDDVTNEAILQDVRDLLQKASDSAIIKRREWLEQNEGGNPNQGKLFDNEDSKDEDTVITGKNPVGSPQGKKKKRQAPDDGVAASDEGVAGI